MQQLLPAETSASLIGQVHLAECLDLCERVYRAGVRVDMILADLPYATTQNEWDALIPFAPMWKAFNRITRPGAAIVLTASQPFTSLLVCSNLKKFRYEWIWRKPQGSNFLDANRKPMKQHESVLVFCQQAAPYYPQMSKGTPYITGQFGHSSNWGKFERVRTINEDGSRYPKSVIDFDTEVGLHPTQKPTELFRYLVRTYTQPNELVFDPTCGSGTTADAAREEGRRFIVGDNSSEYVQVARNRLAAPYTPSFMPQLETA